MSYFTDPAQQWTLELDRAKASQSMGQYARMANDPNLMNNLANYSLQYPQGSAALGLALAQGGIPASDPSVQSYVNQEIATRGVLGPVDEAGDSWTLGDVDDQIVGKLKGATRWGFAAWDAAYNLLAGGAPIRAKELASDTGMSYGDAWREQDPYFFEALGGLVSGEHVNLGSGWLPNSDVADDVNMQVQSGMEQIERDTQNLGANERMTTRLQAAPGVWRDAVQGSLEQSIMGKPLTQMNYADTESVMFDVKQWAGGQTVQTPWSPGRMLAANLVEPGTDPYHKISGTGDFMSQVFLDPVDWFGGAWAKAGVAGRRIWGLGKEVAEHADEVKKVVSYASEAEAAGRVLPGRTADEVVSATASRALELPPTERMLALTGDMSPQVGLPGRDAYVTTPAGQKIPWWRSSEAKGDRIANAYDPPDWYIDQARNQRAGALEDWSGKSSRVVNGAYDMPLPKMEGQAGTSARIFRRGEGKGKDWDVTMPDGSRLPNSPDDPRFDVLGTRFNTKAEAEEAVRRHVQAQGSPGFDDLSVHGMSEDEFLKSFEDLYVQDDIRFLKSSRSDAMPSGQMHKTGAPTGKNARGNARVRVFGKSIDATSGLVDDLPSGLQDALKLDRKVRGGHLAGIPNTDTFPNTLKWMENNGVGKLAWDEDTVLISDKMVGGNSRDPMGRMWFEDGNKPMSQFDILDETMGTPTPNEIRNIVDEIVAEAQFYQTNKVPVKGTGDIGLAGDGFKMPEMHPGGVADEFASEVTPIQNFINNADEATLAALSKKELTAKFGGEVADDILARIKQVVGENAGGPSTLDGVRPDFDAGFQLKGKKADAFAARIAAVAEAGDGKGLDRLLKFAKDLNNPVPNSVKQRLLDAKSPEEVKRIFGEWLVKEGGQEMILPGGMQYGRLSAAAPLVGAIGSAPGFRQVGAFMDSRTWASRQFAEALGGNDVNILENPTAAYGLFEDAMPHYNINRGSELVRFDKDGKATKEVIKIEEIFDDLRTMEENDLGAAYSIMGRFSEAMFSSLVGDGVDAKLARQSAEWWRENLKMANFDAERFGRIDLGSSPYDMTVVNDELIGGLGPQLTADLWSGAIKPIDQRTMRRISAETDLIGKIANRMTWKPVEGDTGRIILQDRVYVQFLDAIITKIWKPFVLLRGAWTLRILMDDQLRMAAEGYSMFNHPLRVMQSMIANPKFYKDAMSGGTVDVFGTAMKLDDISEMQHADLFIRSMMGKPDANFGIGAYGTRQHVSTGKGDLNKYTEGLTFEMRQLRGSELTQRLASSGSEKRIDEGIAYLKSDEGAMELRNQAELHGKMEGIRDKIMAKDEATLRNIVSRQDAILHHRMGGKVYLDNGNGQLLNFDELTGIGAETEITDGVAKWIVKEDGDADLLKWVAGQDTIMGKNVGDIATDDTRKALQDILKTKVKESNNYPKAVRRPKIEMTGESARKLTEQLDGGIAQMFKWFMSVPSDRLSRSPEFRRAYWEKMEELAPYMSKELRQAVANPTKGDEVFSAPNPNRILNPKAKGAGIEGQLTDIEQADLFAKSFGLAMVERTLFDLTNRRNISDAMRLVFPFGEAWGEFITRWGRLMVSGDRNIKNLNRLRQSVGGARRSGTFQENEFGDEEITYPAFLNAGYAKAHDIVNNLPMGEKMLGPDIGQYMENVKTTGNVESLNFASGVIPGFGPVFQIAARQLPNDPDYDWVRDLISPFGTEGNLAYQFAPAWVKRMAAAHGGQDDPQLTYQYNSTVMDIMRTKIDQGEFSGVTEVKAINALVAEAQEEAKALLAVRAAATFFNPASPRYKFQKEDKDGLVWSYSNLGQAYYELKEEVGEDAAWDEFYKRFGFLPAAFTGGKTYGVVDRSTDVEGSRFERSHEGIFQDYPSVAMYFDPNVHLESEYDHGAMLRQLDQGLRESYNAEQFAYLQQDQLGDIWWERTQSIAAGFGSGPGVKDRKDAFLASQRETIESKYPFWNKPIPGKKQAVTNDQQREELLNAIEDPALAGAPIIEPVRIYESLREQVLEQIRAAGASTIDGPKSTTSESGRVATYGRNWLRERAAELEMQYPQFGPLFRTVYSNEVNESHDATKATVWNLYDEGDIFDEVYGETG